MAEPNQTVFNRVADSYTDLSLDPAERRLLARCAGHLAQMDMLDLGVGTGRTGYTFAPLVRRYVGLDYAPEMIERARILLGDDANVELVIGDARDLSAIDGQFDIVLFSFNGIDAVSYAERLIVIDQVRSVLRPGGWFLFSTHSIWALPLPTRKTRAPSHMRSRLFRSYARLDDLRYGWKVRRLNRRVSLDDARNAGWTLVVGFAHDFRIDDVYIDPVHQVELLCQRGFVVDTIYDVGGRPVTLPHRGRDPWLHYLCRAGPAPS